MDSDDPELFAIEAWMRRQGITGKNEAEREQIVRSILDELQVNATKAEVDM